MVYHLNEFNTLINYAKRVFIYYSWRVGFVHKNTTGDNSKKTLFLSYIIFTKPLTEQHGTRLILISMGIILKMILDPHLPNRSNRE